MIFAWQDTPTSESDFTLRYQNPHIWFFKICSSLVRGYVFCFLWSQTQQLKPDLHSLVMSVNPLVCLHITRLPLVGLVWYLILESFANVCRENPYLVTIGQKHGVPYVKTVVLFRCVSIVLRIFNLCFRSDNTGDRLWFNFCGHGYNAFHDAMSTSNVV